MPTVPLPDDPNLDQLKKQAKELRDAARAGDADALARIAEHHPKGAHAVSLTGAQLVIARQYGFTDWSALRDHIDAGGAPLRLGDVLELVATSRQRWTALHMRATQEFDLSVQMRVFERERPAGTPKRTEPPGAPNIGPTLKETASTAEIWAAGPDRYRIEATPGPTLTVCDGESSWTRNADGEITFTTGDASPMFNDMMNPWSSLLDPRLAVLGLDVEPIARSTVARRPTYRVKLLNASGVSSHVIASGRRQAFVPFRYGDHTELEIDAETGVVLGFVTTLEGQLLRRTTVTEIGYGVAIDEHLLRERPPPGARVVRTPQTAASIEDVARRAPFTIWIPEGPQRFTGFYHEASASRPHRVMITRLPDLVARPAGLGMGPITVMQLWESDVRDAVADPSEWQPIDAGGRSAHIWQAPDAGEVHVRVDCGATFVWLRGLDDRDEMLAAAAALQPVYT